MMADMSSIPQALNKRKPDHSRSGLVRFIPLDKHIFNRFQLNAAEFFEYPECWRVFILKGKNSFQETYA